MQQAKLYSFWRSSASWRVRIALALKEIDYDYIAVDLLQGEQETEDYIRRNPLRQLPTLEWMHEGQPVRLSQSVAILHLLAELPGLPLLPESSLLRARAWQLAEIVNAGIQPLQNLSVLSAIVELGGDRNEWASNVIRRGFVAMEEIASATSGAFLVGNRPTVADICLVPQMFNARRHELDLTPFPTLRRVDAHCAKLPAFVAAHADAQPDAI